MSDDKFKCARCDKWKRLGVFIPSRPLDQTADATIKVCMHCVVELLKTSLNDTLDEAED